jgi:hypothetical protein
MRVAMGSWDEERYCYQYYWQSLAPPSICEQARLDGAITTKTALGESPCRMLCRLRIILTTKRVELELGGVGVGYPVICG